jgi:hypothetical protein
MRGVLALVAASASLVALKLLLLARAASPFNFFDELGYVVNARTLVREVLRDDVTRRMSARVRFVVRARS